MAGFYNMEDSSLRLKTSSTHSLHSTISLSSPVPNSAPGSINSRFDHSPLTTFFVTPEGSMGKTKRERSKSTPGNGAPETFLKHRRTRSGCFTCRTRRVKCDENRPICDRCAKGGRECNYPEVVPSTKQAGKSKREKAVAEEVSTSPSPDEKEGEDGEGAPMGPGMDTAYPFDNHLPQSAMSEDGIRNNPWPSFLSERLPLRSQSASLMGSSLDVTPSPGTNDLVTHPDSPTPSSPTTTGPETIIVNGITRYIPTDLPQDEIFYLRWFVENVNCHHYLLKSDNENFFRGTLVVQALSYRPLWLAVVGFGAFHFTLQRRLGLFHNFFEFYNRAVVALRVEIEAGNTGFPALLTTLQLASFEEYLGDWCNLMDHRNAATSLLEYHYTPDTMAATADLRIVYNWFTRFDIFAAMMAGHQTTLSRQWCDRNREACREIMLNKPGDVTAILDHALATLRSLAMECSILTAKKTQGVINIEEFEVEAEKLRNMCQNWFENLDPILFQEVEEVPRNPLEPDHPFLPTPVYKGLRWPVNFLLLDYYGLRMMMRHQLQISADAGTDSVLADLAVSVCKVLAAIQGPDAPHGALLAAQAALGLCALWLPPNPTYRFWIQRQLASIEQMGYIFPFAFRNRISELWQDPDLVRTWSSHLDPKENFGDVLRTYIDDREQDGPQDPRRLEVRNMSALLTNMKNLNCHSSSAGSPLDSEPSALPPTDMGMGQDRVLDSNMSMESNLDLPDLMIPSNQDTAMDLIAQMYPMTNPLVDPAPQGYFPFNRGEIWDGQGGGTNQRDPAHIAY